MKWEMVKLDLVAEVIAGQSPESKYYNQKGDGIPFFQGKADFGVDHPNVRYYCTAPTKIAKPLDILMSVRAPVGPTNICNIEACVGRGLAAIRSGENLDYKYLYFYLKAYEHKLAESSNGSTFSAITTGVVKEIPIPLPPLATQKRIAEILDKADAMRQKDQALLRKYDELAQAVFVDMFGDPVKNEKGWEKYRFDQIFDSRLGKMLDAKKQTRKNAYKYLGNSNVLWGKFNMNNLHEMDFDDKDRRIFKLQKGDLLICEGGEVGRTAIWEGKLENVFFQKAIHRARPIEKNITPEFAMKLMWFLAKFGGLDDYVTSATIAHLTGEKLKTIMIPLPPIDLQQRFSNCLHNINIQKGQLEQDSSESLFQSLLQKAFTGELVA